MSSSPISTFMNVRTATLLALFAVAHLSVSAQTMYKCSEGGKTIYQAQPCPDSAAQGTVKAASPPPLPSKSATGAARSLDQTLDFLSSYRACADAMSFWREEMAAPYAQWRKTNAAMVGKIEGDPKSMAELQARTDAKRNGKASMCRPVALELRGVKQ
jgi:Domain of unknown function (DUF4124)